jgi:ribonuclease E
VIDGTEALTAIDVNTRGSARSGEAEDAAVQTNLEAAAEIGRQMRLRDLGGLLVIDFIDMMKAANQKKVEKAMRDAMKGDKARYDVTRISKLGLLEIARQRIKGEKMGRLLRDLSGLRGVRPGEERGVGGASPPSASCRRAAPGGTSAACAWGSPTRSRPGS